MFGCVHVCVWEERDSDGADWCGLVRDGYVPCFGICFGFGFPIFFLSS